YLVPSQQRIEDPPRPGGRPRPSRSPECRPHPIVSPTSKPAPLSTHPPQSTPPENFPINPPTTPPTNNQQNDAPSEAERFPERSSSSMPIRDRSCAPRGPPQLCGRQTLRAAGMLARSVDFKMIEPADGLFDGRAMAGRH